MLAIGTRWVWAATCSLGNGALLFSLELETYSKRALLWGEGGWGLKTPCVHWPHHPNFRQLWQDLPRAHLRKGTKLASGSGIRESETLLGKPTSAPMRVCSGKQRFPVSPLGLCLPWAKEVLGCLLLPWHWCCAGGLWRWKPTPNVHSFAEKADGARKGLVCTGPSTPYSAS